MNQLSYFDIHATEPKILVDFYSKVFGRRFELDPKVPVEYYRIFEAGPFGWLIKIPGRAPATIEHWINAFTCSMEVEYFDATAQLIIEHWGSISMPKFAIPGKCWQWYFMDPDHNEFGIFQVDEKAGL